MFVQTLFLGFSAYAQDAELPDDIFETEETIAEETRSVAEGAAEPEELLEKRRKSIIQIFQPKEFLKLGRYELGFTAGAVTNDPFLVQYMLTLNGAYHVTEVLAIEATATYSPFSQPNCSATVDGVPPNCPDFKQVTRQIIQFNEVTPDISRIAGVFGANIMFSPIYGKVATGNGLINVDIFGVLGTGAVLTFDDVLLSGAENNPQQWHPMVSFGGGARVIFGKNVAVRVEGRGLSYIETLSGVTLEMKNNFAVLGGLSLFFPGMK
ncbi:MAG: outer membrane beta-barrel domain-containing protein [Myxococcota bacterium]